MHKGILVCLMACVVLVFLASTAVGAGKDGKDSGKKRRRRVRANQDATSIFSGTTPSGSTRWKADSHGSIYTTVDTSHLKFDRIPRYLCSVVSDSRGSKYLENVNGTLSVEELYGLNELGNVTGKTVPRSPSTNGFRVRLRYDTKVGKNLTETTARLGGWRVRWVAITESHSLVEAARADVKSKRFENSVEDKPAGQALVYVKMLEALAKEETSLIQPIVGMDYELPVSKRPKKKKVEKKEEGKKEESSKEEKTNEEAAKTEDNGGENGETAKSSEGTSKE